MERSHYFVLTLLFYPAHNPFAGHCQLEVHVSTGSGWAALISGANVHPNVGTPKHLKLKFVQQLKTCVIV